MAEQEEDENPSFLLLGKQSLTYANRPIPTLHDPHDVLINVRYTGICASDITFWQHGGIGPYTVDSPMVLGHESAGIVTAVGAAVTTLTPGDRVCLEPGIPCRRCPRCKAGTYNLCPSMRFAATPPTDGTLAKFYALPEDLCYKLPASMTLREGALMEPLAVAVHMIRQADLRDGPSQTLVVFGAGPVGLLCCAVARAHGVAKITAVDLDAERLAFAASYAATATILARRDEDPADFAARILTSADLPASGADIAIDATGAAPCINTAQYVLRRGGTYVQGGISATWTLDAFPMMSVCAGELTVRGSFRYSAGDFAMAVALVGSGKVSVRELVTGTVGFWEAERAFERVRAGRGVKTLIRGPGVGEDGEVG